MEDNKGAFKHDIDRSYFKDGFRRYTIVVPMTDKLVWLQLKNKPAWQKGMLNFPGGKFEPNETGPECAVREFYEETGVKFEPEELRYVGKFFRENDFECFIYYVNDPRIENIKAPEGGEEFFVFDKDNQMDRNYMDPRGFKLMPNIRTIFEFIQSPDFQKYNCTLDIAYDNDWIPV